MNDRLSNLESPLSTRRPIVELLALAAPTVAQMSSYTLMQFIDTWLLTHHLGDAAATAASNSGMFAFAAISLGFGVLLLVNTLASQSFGQGNHAHCGRYLWQGIWCSGLFAVLLLPVVPLVRFGFVQFDHPPDLLHLEMVYLRIVVSAAVVKFASTALGQFLLAINRPGAVLVATVIGVSANALAAWTLIPGRLGFSSWGVAGAAWAQNLGTTVELLVLVLFVFRRSIRATFALADWRPRLQELRTLLRVGLPSGVQITTEVLAWSLFVAGVIGHFGTTAMAANTYMFRYMSVSFMPAIGIGNAVTALVGRYIGAGRLDLAAHRSHLGFRLAFVYMLVTGIVFIAARYWLIDQFTDDPVVLRLGATLMVFAAAYELFDAMYIVYSGALRGAGDTFVPAVATALLCWCIMLLGGRLIAHLWPAGGVIGPWLAATAYGILLGLFMLRRFLRGGWKAIHLEKVSPGDRA